MTVNNSSFLVTFFTPRGSEFQSESELAWSLYIYFQKADGRKYSANFYYKFLSRNCNTVAQNF